MCQKNHNFKRIKIAKVTKVHGLNGNFYILPFSDNLDLFSDLSQLYLHNGTSIPIESCSKSGRSFLVKSPLFSSIEEVEKIKGEILHMDIPFSSDDYFIDDLINFNVFYDGDHRGMIDGYYPQGIDGFINVKVNEKKSFLVPCQNEFFLDIDLSKKEVHLNSKIFEPIY